VIRACSALEIWIDTAVVSSELRKYGSGGDAFSFKASGIFVDESHGVVILKTTTDSLSRISKWPRKSFGDIADKAMVESRLVHQRIEGLTELMHSMRSSRLGADERHNESALSFIAVESMRLAGLEKNRHLAQASGLFCMFELRRLILLHDLRYRLSTKPNQDG
jgi:hypothetical protein